MQIRYYIVLLFSWLCLKAESQDTIQVALSPGSSGLVIPNDFAGLSFQKSDLISKQFTPSQSTLIQFFKTLGISLIRIGGHVVDEDTFSVSAGSHRFTRAEIDSFYLFVQKVNCHVLWGLNLGGDSNPSLAASEASYVMQHYAANVWGFEVGNEPDLYHKNGYRSPSYWYPQYEAEYLIYYDSILHYYPSAIFTGPVTASSSASTTFTEPFGRGMKGKFSVLTQHYYALSGTSTASTHQQIINLLSEATMSALVTEATGLVLCSDSIPVTFHMSECNSINNGGTWGVSNSFASALWVLDYMYALASVGCAGVNIHNPFYNPYSVIAQSGNAYSARPIYYGILAFQAGSKGKFIPTTITNNHINLHVYSVNDTSANELFVTMVNKDTLQNAVVKLNAGSPNYTAASYITLISDSLADTTNTSLGGQTVSAGGICPAFNWQSLSITANNTEVKVPAGSAMIIRFSGTTTSINNLDLPQSSFTVFPNPVSTVLHLSIPSETINTQLSIQLTDIAGRVLLTDHLSLTTYPLALNVSSLNPGIYFIRINSSNGTEVKKFIKE